MFVINDLGRGTLAPVGAEWIILLKCK